MIIDLLNDEKAFMAVMRRYIAKTLEKYPPREPHKESRKTYIPTCDYVFTRTGRGIVKYDGHHQGLIVGVIEENGRKYLLTDYRDNISANSASWQLFVLTEEGELKKLDLRLAANRRIKKTILEERRKRKKEV